MKGIIIDDDVGEVLDEAILEIRDKTGVRLTRKEMVPLIFKDYKEVASLAIKNFKHRLERL